MAKTTKKTDEPKNTHLSVKFLGKSLLTLAFYTEDKRPTTATLYPGKSIQVIDIPENRAQLENYKKLKLVKF